LWSSIVVVLWRIVLLWEPTLLYASSAAWNSLYGSPSQASLNNCWTVLCSSLKRNLKPLMFQQTCQFLEIWTDVRFCVKLVTFILQITDLYARKQLLHQRVLAIAILSVRLSVCPSHGWISQNRRKLGLPNRLFTVVCLEDFRIRKAFL